MNKLVFVLELENGIFYIGSTQELGKCLGAHFNGKGIALTRDNRVIRILEWTVVPPNGGSYLELKNRIISDYTDRYGWDYVWGGQRLPKA